MASHSLERKSGAVERGLARLLAGAVLPGDAPFGEEALESAADFSTRAARTRRPGEPVVALESVSGAAGSRFLRIGVINDDMPFLVDSIASTVAAQGLGIDRLVHPVMPVRRGSDGQLLEIVEEGEDSRESLVYLETDRAAARQRQALVKALNETLDDVQAAVGDWETMQATLEVDSERISAGEERELLRWMAGGMMTQLGHLIRHRNGTAMGLLGICRHDTGPVLGDESWRRAFAWFEEDPTRELLIVKSNRMARVHRRAPLDLFVVPLRESGKVNALSVHVGLWTSAALATPPGQVPLLRARLDRLSQHLGFNPKGHAGKALVHALTVLPHDIVIGFAESDLARLATILMSLVDRPRVRLALAAAPLMRHLFAFVWLPRDAMSTAVREQIQDLLEKGCNAPLLDWSLAIEGGLAMLRFQLDLSIGASLPDEAALDASLQGLVRGWSDAVEAEIARDMGAARAAAVASRYAAAFPLAYRSSHGPAEAAADIAQLQRLATGRIWRGVRLYCLPEDGPARLRLKVYQRHGNLALSDAVPGLENFGFRVVEDVPTPLVAKGETIGAIHDFLLTLPMGLTAGEVLDRRALIEEALALTANGKGEDDGFNRLVTCLGLTSLEANWLRALYRYLRQAGLTYGIATAVAALAGAPDVTRGLIALFRARHDPAAEGEGEDVAREAIRLGLTGVKAINDDRLLRRYAALVEAILRTNAFVPADHEALAFKFDSTLVPGLPRPVPWREVFVYSARVEGIHLRAGPVARGGIRWSDRRDDFRTEILGLMKAQRVKNAVIVPTGAKGGFYPKRLPDPAREREAWATEGRESYQVFIRSLLSLTDNIVDGKVVHPAGMIVRDGEDPYFVVAADKGTASFSDTANALAAEHEFWLGDAFASGGSKGYDHKAMGITARGAWISVQRHFRELGVDVQADPVRVVGVGDMSGDVFGNGMLLSKSIRLVAAFDHRHVFLDPALDATEAWAAKAWEERARLFALPRSSWDDYDRSLISPGGGVFPRSQKDIPLSAEVREALGLTAESCDPDTLIGAILRAQVDLLWFGGIGTYVKAAGEANAEVGDPANDALRINGSEVRARAIGEGANLGCTQAGRIEYALTGAGGTGGRDNPDFIDNSAGVDCSDKEVNIKIALASAQRAGRLAEPARIALLGEMTDAVAELVLEDNRLQALALSIAEAGGVGALPGQLRVVDTLEENGQLDRATEGLASSAVLARRATDTARGLTRPELAVILSSAKLALQDGLERSGLPDDPSLEGDLIGAFPPAMRERFREDILTHRLRREIIATRLANRMVNRLGPVHPFELAEEEGASLAQVTAAFVAAERLFGLTALFDMLETADMPEAARIVLFARAAEAVRGQMADLLRAGGDLLRPGRTVSELGAPVSVLAAARGELLGAEARAQSARWQGELVALGAPEEAARAVAGLAEMDGAVGLARLAERSGIAPEALTRAYTEIGARLGLDWAQGAAARLTPGDPWERLLVAGLAREFKQMRFDLLARLARDRDEDPVAAVGRWMAQREGGIGRFAALVERARAGVATPAMLAQVAGQARSLLGR